MADWREALQDAMYPVLTRLLQEGFVLPLFVTCIGRNGSMMCGRYDDIEATGPDFIFEASHIEDAAFLVPIHMLLEETVFYPAFAEQADEEGKQLVSEALQDHQQLRDLIATLQDVAEDEAFETRFQALRDHMDQHVEDEETTIFPEAAEVLATHWEEITGLLQERKAQILAS